MKNRHPALSLRALVRRLPHFPPGGQYFFSQANTSLCQYSLFFGFSTQWP